jgi:hypothetical protein
MSPTFMAFMPFDRTSFSTAVTEAMARALLTRVLRCVAVNTHRAKAPSSPAGAAP